MRKFLIAAAATLAIAFGGASFAAKAEKAEKADKAEKGKTVTGVLIDNACAAKNKTEADAAKHPKACALKCAKDGGFALVHGDHVMKLDEAGNKLATEYLEKHDSTKVTVEGTPNKEMTSITITKIEEAKAEKASAK